MSERLEKLYTLTDIDNPPEAPVTIEAGGLIKDNQTGRVIARMYLKNCSEKPLSSVLVGFRPHGENGRIVSGMRDYLYDAEGIPVGEIFGDQTGILFDNNETKSFSANVEEVDFEDGEYWDADEAKKKAEELKLIVPEEKEPVQQEQVVWEKPAEPVKAPEVWKSESDKDEPHSAEIYGAAIVEQKMEAPVEEEFVPASLETRQLEHEDRPALEEETDAYRDDQEKAVINLDGPSEDEGPVIELGGPVKEEETARPEPEEASEEAEVTVEHEEIPAVAEEAPAEPEHVEEKIPEEPAPVAEGVPEEPAPAEEVPTEPAAAPVEEEVSEEPAPAEEVPFAEETPEPEAQPEEPTGPVRLADMYSGVGSASTLASLAALYGMKHTESEETHDTNADEVPAEPAPVGEEIPEEPEVAAGDVPEEPAPVAEEITTEPAPFAEEAPEEVETEEPAPFAEVVPEEPALAEEKFTEAHVPVTEEVAAAEGTSEPIEQEIKAEPERHSVIDDMENPWAGYSADYAPPLGAVKEDKPVEASEPIAEEVPAAPAPAEVETAEEPATAEEEIPEEPTPVIEEAPVEKIAEEPVTAGGEIPGAEEVPAAETSAVKAEELVEEHIPTIEETIELPKAVIPEKSPEDASEILAAAAAKTEPEISETVTEKTEEAKAAVSEDAEGAAEEAKPLQQKADVVFAQENEVIPSIIDDSKEKALTGEDHSGRNLLNIVVFGGIALIILLVLLIKM